MADAWDSDDDGIIDGLDEQEQAEVAAAEQAAGRIRTYTPNSEKLNSYSVMSIIINRMIGQYAPEYRFQLFREDVKILTGRANH